MNQAPTLFQLSSLSEGNTAAAVYVARHSWSGQAGSGG